MDIVWSSGGGSAPLGGHLVSSSHIKKGHKANSVSSGKAPVLLSRFVGVETFRVQLLCYKETINLSKIADESKCLVLGTIEEL